MAKLLVQLTWIAAFALVFVYCLPVDLKQGPEIDPKKAEEHVDQELDDLGLEYGRYLQQVGDFR